MYIINDINWIKLLKENNVFVFGCGKKGRGIAASLKRESVTVSGFIDNDTSKCGGVVDSLCVISLKEYIDHHNDDFIVICSGGYEREIKQQLLEEGISKYVASDQLDFGGGAEYYDDVYFQYEKSVGEFGAKVKKRLFQKYISDQDVVVEFGMGGGFLLKEINAASKIGIEINDVAREYAESIGIKSVKYSKSLENDFADVIISNSALEHVENPFGELKELYRVLKPGGKAVFYVPNESCETEYKRSEINNHLYTWNCLNLGNLFKAAGYFVYSVERIQEMWPTDFIKIGESIDPGFFDELCRIKGRAEEANRCLIVAYK